MAATQPVLKKTRMPPKRPAMPKNPVVRSYRPGKRADLRCQALCDGGPWHGQSIMMRFGEPTIVFQIGPFFGRYEPTCVPRRRVPAEWQTMRVSGYSWRSYEHLSS